MDTPFETVVAALWSSLGLGQPSLKDDASVALTVDGITLMLSRSPDERHALVSAQVGRLAQDPVQMETQLRQLLRESAALALSKRAALRLEAGTERNAPGEIVAQACAPCRVDAVPLLRRAIEDVLFLVDVHRPTLRSMPTRVSAPAIAAADLEGSLIFRL